MSKKPQRSRHRAGPVPWSDPKPVELGDTYENEVRRSTEKLERQYARAVRRLQQAQDKLRAAKEKLTAPRRSAPKRHTIAELELLVEERRAELEELRRMMQFAPASAQHRGTSSYRPVPVSRG